MWRNTPKMWRNRQRRDGTAYWAVSEVSQVSSMNVSLKAGYLCCSPNLQCTGLLVLWTSLFQPFYFWGTSKGREQPLGCGGIGDMLQNAPNRSHSSHHPDCTRQHAASCVDTAADRTGWNGKGRWAFPAFSVVENAILYVKPHFWMKP